MAVLVGFKDGTVKVFDACDTYTANRDFGCFFIEKNNHRIMLPCENVLYICYEEDVRD